MIAFLETSWPTLAFLAAIGVLFLIFRNRATKIEDIGAILGRGEPVVIEIFSNT